jgi:hypothetical protein
MIVSMMLLLMSSNIGEWLAFDETNNFDGSRRISAIQSAEDDTFDDKPSLFMACDKVGGVTMHLYQSDEKRSYGNTELPVAIRFGERRQTLDGRQTNFWKADGVLLYYSGTEIATFAEQAEAHGSVTIDVWTDKGKSSATFLAEGTLEVYQYLAKNCPKAAEANTKLNQIDAVD